jgi:large subunit ribosomal protein L30
MYAVVKIRGSNHTKVDIKYALKELRLHRVNHLVLIPEDMIGQVKKVKDYVTWGEIDKEHLIKLLKERGKLLGDKPITEEWLKQNGYGKTKEPFKLGGNLGYRGIEINKLIDRMIEGGKIGQAKN